jgi:hypothetical protein
MASTQISYSATQPAGSMPRLPAAETLPSSQIRGGGSGVIFTQRFDDLRRIITYQIGVN